MQILKLFLRQFNCSSVGNKTLIVWQCWKYYCPYTRRVSFSFSKSAGNIVTQRPVNLATAHSVNLATAHPVNLATAHPADEMSLPDYGSKCEHFKQSVTDILQEGDLQFKGLARDDVKGETLLHFLDRNISSWNTRKSCQSWRLPSSGMWRRAVWQKFTGVSYKHISCMFWVEDRHWRHRNAGHLNVDNSVLDQ
jgi:hypothetical protein